MAGGFEVIDIWLGCFSSVEASNDYFEETYDTDSDQPISQFAADMGESFYDHDFMELGDFHDPPLDDLARALAPHSFASSYLPQAQAFFSSGLFPAFNFVVLVWNCEIEHPVSVIRPGRSLHYLGRFECDPELDETLE